MKLFYSARNKLKLIALFVAVLVILYFDCRYPFYKFFPNIWWMQLAWWLSIFSLVGILGPISREWGKWVRGDEAEQEVEDVSYELPESFKILRKLIPGKIGDVDEIIVGPTGIWAIEVKGHAAGKITFDERELRRDGKLFEKDFLEQARNEMNAVRDILKRELKKEFFVQPVICFSDVDMELHFGHNLIRGVYVIGLDWLNKLILKNPAPRKLDDLTIDEIEKVLEKYEG